MCADSRLYEKGGNYAPEQANVLEELDGRCVSIIQTLPAVASSVLITHIDLLHFPILHD